MSKQLKADGMLIIVTLCWGASYYAADVCLRELDPFTLNAYRFFGAFVILGILFHKRLRNVSRKTLIYSLMIGLSLVMVYMGSTFGVKYTTLSNSGFLCALPVVFTPIFEFLFFKRKPERKLLASVIICFVGIALLTLKEDFSLNIENLKGDAFSLVCAVSYSIDLILTGEAVKHEEVDAFQLGVFSLGVTGVADIAIAFIMETPVVPKTPEVWVAAVFLTVFCTGVALIIQPIAQQYTTPSHVGVIFTLEPVFAMIVAIIFAHEILIARAYFGAFLMFTSIILLEVDFKSIFKNKTKRLGSKEEEQ